MHITFARLQDQKISVLWGLGLAVALLFPIIPIPRAAAISSLPWKGELACGLFLLVAAVWVFIKKTTVFRIPNFRTLYLAAAAFTTWSGLSVIWAYSAGWAVHHTLVWSCYLLFLFLVLVFLKRGGSLSVIYFALGLLSVILVPMMVLDLASGGDFFSFEGTFRIRYGKFGEMLLTASPLLATAVFYSRRRFATLALAAIWLLSWLGVMLSLSRGAFLAGILAHFVLFVGALFFSGMRGRKTLLLAAAWLIFSVCIQIGTVLLTNVPSASQYVGKASDPTSMTVSFRKFAWRVGSDMALHHWLLGVGADNFGIAFDRARAELAARHPENRDPEIAEDYVVERAHNEPLQIAGELGIVGSVLISTVFAAFAWSGARALKAARFRMSPIFWGAVAGMAGFIASSMVSSFSFRAIQNGIVFIMMMAVAINEIGKTQDSVTPSINSRRFAALGVFAALLMVIFAGSKAFAEYTVLTAERTVESRRASELFERAILIDPDHASAYSQFAARLAATGDFVRAASYLRQGIDRGLGTTVTYSKLAEYQTRAGDKTSAEQTLAEAVSIYPNSVFLRVRNATFLAEHGENSDASREMAYASSVDPRQAAGWQIIMTRGSVAAFYRSQEDPGVAAPKDLIPAAAVFGYLDKTDMFAEPGVR